MYYIELFDVSVPTKLPQLYKLKKITYEIASTLYLAISNQYKLSTNCVRSYPKILKFINRNFYIDYLPSEKNIHHDDATSRTDHFSKILELLVNVN